MKQSDISQQLGSLIGQTSGIYNTVGADVSIPSELQEPDPIFEINYGDELTQSRNEAFQTVGFIIKSVIPERYQDNDMILNQQKLDAIQMGNLYYQQKINNIALQTAMDTLAKGDTQPRMFEVIDKLQKRAADITDQIIQMQNQFRKYYIDCYLDLESKEKYDSDDLGLPPGARPSKFIQQTSPVVDELPNKAPSRLQQPTGEGILVSGSGDGVKSLQEKRMRKLKEEAQQKAKEAEFSEI